METMVDNLEHDESAIEKENIPSSQQPADEQGGSTVTISVESPHEQHDAQSAFSTPLTVKDRVQEYYHRTGGQGDSSSLSGSKSLSSSQGSLRDFGKDDKEWMLAACACDVPALRRLLASNRRLVNYKFPFNGFTAMHFAAKMNRPDCCRLLADSGASADAKTYAGQTPLHMACQQESREAMEYLMKLPSKAAHTPDYSGRLPHELIRNRDAFDEILYKTTSVGLAKRGSFLGEYPGSIKSGDSASVSSGSSSATSSWLSGVRASFRGKSGQPKMKSGGSLLVPGGQPGSRVPNRRSRHRLSVLSGSDDSDS